MTEPDKEWGSMTIERAIVILILVVVVFYILHRM